MTVQRFKKNHTDPANLENQPADFPLVSVCVPSYNHAKYIPSCLDSIRDDPYPNKEIVVIDDGSTDRSPEVIEEWRRTNPKVTSSLTVRENRGISATFNELLARSRGSYICFIASDDLLISGSIAARLEVLGQNPHKYAAIGDALIIDSDGHVLFESAIDDYWKANRKNYETDEKLKYSVINEWSVSGPVLMVKREIYDIVGPYPEDLFAEDLNFYLKVIGLNLLVFIDRPVACYRVHDTNCCMNTQYGKEISYTFIRSYLNNIKYYHGSLRMTMIRKVGIEGVAYFWHLLKARKNRKRPT